MSTAQVVLLVDSTIEKASLLQMNIRISNEAIHLCYLITNKV